MNARKVVRDTIIRKKIIYWRTLHAIRTTTKEREHVRRHEPGKIIGVLRSIPRNHDEARLGRRHRVLKLWAKDDPPTGFRHLGVRNLLAR